MNDFEIQRGLRAMNTPRPPGQDLWPAIAARIRSDSETTAPVARRRWIPLAAAAGTLLAIVGGIAMNSLREREAPSAYADAFPRIERISPPRLWKSAANAFVKRLGSIRCDPSERCQPPARSRARFGSMLRISCGPISTKVDPWRLRRSKPGRARSSAARLW